jgi:hypothetical protein
MTDGVPDPVTIDAKRAALANLRDYAQWVARRDPLVCAARQAGASYDEIIEASTLSRGTVTSILTKAGLVGRHSPSKEALVPTSTAPAQFYPHHPHFVEVQEEWGGTMYTYAFRPFSGDEPEPVPPPYPSYVPEEDRTAEDDARLLEWRERNREMDAARKLWQQARYHRQITPLVEAAIKARPPVDQALDAMQRAWEALDNTLVWPAAVKGLLDAQDAARAAMAQWVDDYAYPLAEAEASQPYYIREEVADWKGIAAAKFNGGQRISWDIGFYYADSSYSEYSESPLDDLNCEIKRQRDKLAEIAKYNKPDPA